MVCCEPLFGRAGELDGGFNIEGYGMVIVCKVMQRYVSYEYGVPWERCWMSVRARYSTKCLSHGSYRRYIDLCVRGLS
jgi:hypothetical protein